MLHRFGQWIICTVPTMYIVAYLFFLQYIRLDHQFDVLPSSSLELISQMYSIFSSILLPNQISLVPHKTLLHWNMNSSSLFCQTYPIFLSISTPTRLPDISYPVNHTYYSLHKDVWLLRPFPTGEQPLLIVIIFPAIFLPVLYSWHLERISYFRCIFMRHLISLI